MAIFTVENVLDVTSSTFFTNAPYEFVIEKDLFSFLTSDRFFCVGHKQTWPGLYRPTGDWKNPDYEKMMPTIVGVVPENTEFISSALGADSHLVYKVIEQNPISCNIEWMAVVERPGAEYKRTLYFARVKSESMKYMLNFLSVPERVMLCAILCGKNNTIDILSWALTNAYDQCVNK